MLNMRVAWIVSSFQLSCFALKAPPPLNIEPITPKDFTTLKSQATPFGFQNALDNHYSSTNGTITLFPNACIQADGTRNCTIACQKNAQMFSNLETLHNCAVFPEISVNLANKNLTANARRLAEELNIEPSNDKSSLPSRISNAIQRCLVDTCKGNEDCKGTLNPTNGTNRNHSPSDLTGTLFIKNTFFPLCAPIPAYVNADVGGIGVFISYTLQLGLALLAFIVTIPWSSIIKGIRTSVVYYLSALFTQRRSENSKQHSPALSAQSDRKYPEALATALVDFQKAQCFFMLATNIASLIIESNGGLAPESLQQLYNTYVFIKVIAIGGYLPITFTLLNLHMIKQLSWYLLFLSITTIAVATTTLLMSNTAFMPTPEDYEQITSLASQGGPPSCASQNLVPWCYNPRKGGNFGFNASSSGSGANDILVFCLVTLVIITVDHFCRSDDPNQQNLNRRILTKLGISTSRPLFPHAGIILRFGTAAFYFIFFWLYIYCFYIFGDDLSWFTSNDIYDPSWGFGQIVAILVWAPTLCDYLWHQIRGVPKGTEHKTPRMYEVVKRVQEHNEAESTFESRDIRKESPY